MPCNKDRLRRFARRFEVAGRTRVVLQNDQRIIRLETFRIGSADAEEETPKKKMKSNARKIRVRTHDEGVVQARLLEVARQEGYELGVKHEQAKNYMRDMRAERRELKFDSGMAASAVVVAYSFEMHQSRNYLTQSDFYRLVIKRQVGDRTLKEYEIHAELSHEVEILDGVDAAIKLGAELLKRASLYCDTELLARFIARVMAPDEGARQYTILNGILHNSGWTSDEHFAITPAT